MNPVRIVCFLLLFISLRLAAQTDGLFRTERLGTRDGLSHRWTMCALQDSKGYLWVGTYDGLNRYDGNDFTVFRPSASGKLPVSADLINIIVETADGKIQLNTFYGILGFDPETGEFNLLAKNDNTDIAIILNSGKNQSFLNTGFDNFSAADTYITIYETLPSGKLAPLSKLTSFPARDFSPIMCNKEILWFWNGKGCYYQCMLKNQTWTRFPVSGSTTVPIDSGGNLWLPDGTTLRSFPLPGKQQAVHWTTFHLEPGKAVWFRVNGEPDVARLVLYDLKNGSLKTIFSPQNNENLIGYIRAQPYYSRSYMNEEGTIWLTGFPGLTKIRYTSTLFQHFLSKPVEHIEAPPSGRSIRDLAEDAAGNVYVRDAEFNLYKTGTASGVMDKINPPLVSAGNNGMHPDAEFRALQKSRPDLANRVSSVINDPDGYVWFAAPSRLFRYDPVTGQLRHFQVPTSVEVTLFSEDNEIWWITNPESYSVNKRTGALRPLTGLRREHFEYGTMLPKDHTLWGFNDTGLIKVNTRNLDTRYIRLYNEPREQRCLVSHRGWLWVGTSRGLERVDPNTFAHTNFDRSKGLPGNFVYSMVADGDYLWLGTSDGLCRFNVETGATKNFYVEDGLSHNEFNSLSVLKTRNGRIYMGGLNGINAFFPADLEAKTTFKSRILLSKYSLFDTYKDSLVLFNVSTLPEELELPPSVTSLNLHLALTSYLDPAKNQYAWRMDGLDNDWYYAGNQHVASYHHLSPGSYTFRAKAADSFGNWSENELVIRITVLRPWYSRWWAWLAYVFLAGATIFALYRNQLSKRMEHAERLRLQELDSFKNRFFTNITHEFRTPLTVILGMSERLENDGVTSSHPVTLIKRNGQNLLRLINQILDLAKLESHALQIHNIQGDVLPYLRYITESLQSLANAQNVLLRVESKEDELLMDYDPERLLQIVHNLLSNAIKFTPSGGQVVLNIGRVSNPADVLTITVADTGAGIPPGDLPNIFDRFYQANNLEKAKAGGTGIGLSLTMELVKAMGGTITVDSEVGKGAIFTVQLPIANRSERLEARSEKIGIVETDDAFKSKAAHVAISHDLTFRPSLLMIEDNPDVVEYLIACLGENYRLDYAYNGLSGIEKALETVPDLIVSDVMMPEKDGFEVCETLKNDERTSHIPIVLLTARADAASRIAGLRRGADAYLSKPFNKEELLAQLQVLAEKQRRMTAWLSKKMQNEQPLQLPEAVAEADILLEDAFIQKVRDIVAKNYTDEDFGLPQLCREIGMSRSQLFRKMSALIDTSPSDFIRSHRLNEAKKLLETTDLNVSEVAWQCGFVNLAHFSRIFQEEFGVLPSATGK